jgi:hypothetical protein
VAFVSVRATETEIAIAIAIVSKARLPWSLDRLPPLVVIVWLEQSVLKADTA